MAINSLFGPPDISKLMAKGKTKELILLLDYNKDSHIRIQAVQALTNLKCRESVDPICRILNEFSGLNINLSLACANALGNLGDSAAFAPLSEALLRKSHESNLEEVLELTLQRTLISKGFEFKLAKKLAKDWIAARYHFMDIVRIASAKALGKIGNKDAIPILIDTLNDQNPVLSRSASDSLAFFGKEAYTTITKILQNSDIGVKRLLIRTLSQMNLPETIKMLQSFSSDKDEIIQSYAKSLSNSGQWMPPQIELVNELIELFNLYTEIKTYEKINSLMPKEKIDQEKIFEDAAKESVEIFAMKYVFNDQAELEDIMQQAIRVLDKN